MENPADEEFLAIAQEMLMCFNEGKVDYHTNFDSPYDYGSMRYAAWAAGYAKALEQDDTQC